MFKVCIIYLGERPVGTAFHKDSMAESFDSVIERKKEWCRRRESVPSDATLTEVHVDGDHYLVDVKRISDRAQQWYAAGCKKED
jgi:hypothetical protein